MRCEHWELQLCNLLATCVIKPVPCSLITNELKQFSQAGFSSLQARGTYSR